VRASLEAHLKDLFRDYKGAKRAASGHRDKARRLAEERDAVAGERDAVAAALQDVRTALEQAETDRSLTAKEAAERVTEARSAVADLQQTREALQQVAQDKAALQASVSCHQDAIAELQFAAEMSKQRLGAHTRQWRCPASRLLPQHA
jgi:chaperonin cofactor prefoldin